MARREQFSLYLKASERQKLEVLARGAGEAASAYVVGRINETWASVFGTAHPADVSGLFDGEQRRVRCANGQRRRVGG